MAAFAVEADVHHLTLGASRALCLRIGAQVPPVEARVEMIGIIVGRLDEALVGRRRGEAAARGERPGHRIVVERPGAAGLSLLQPILVERDGVELGAIGAEGVEIAVALLAPADELDAELERALRLRDELPFVEAQRMVEQADRRDGRLADADDADLVRFHYLDPAPAPQGVGERGGGHPAGRSAAEDDDLADVAAGHRRRLTPAPPPSASPAPPAP